MPAFKAGEKDEYVLAHWEHTGNGNSSLAHNHIVAIALTGRDEAIMMWVLGGVIVAVVGIMGYFLYRRWCGAQSWGGVAIANDRLPISKVVESRLSGSGYRVYGAQDVPPLPSKYGSAGALRSHDEEEDDERVHLISGPIEIENGHALVSSHGSSSNGHGIGNGNGSGRQMHGSEGPRPPPLPPPMSSAAAAAAALAAVAAKPAGAARSSSGGGVNGGGRKPAVTYFRSGLVGTMRLLHQPVLTFLSLARSANHLKDGNDTSLNHAFASVMSAGLIVRYTPHTVLHSAPFPPSKRP